MKCTITMKKFKIFYFMALHLVCISNIGTVEHTYGTSNITHNGCILPGHPESGKWIIYEYGEASIYPSPGDVVPFNTALQVSCRNNYKLDGDAAILCVGGKWTNKIGKCLRTCPPLFPTSTMNVTCSYNNKELENCIDAVDQTKAKFECADFYEDESLKRHPIHVCYNGRWSNKIPECLPICGLKASTKDPTLIVGGNNVTRGSYPWQIALYNETNKVLLCGGTMLNTRVFLTAAHCVTNNDGKVYPSEFYTIAAGKFFRQYDHPEDFFETQFSGVHKIFIPKKYKADIQNYFGDIAILVSKKTFQLSRRVQPACVDWGLKYDKFLLDPKLNKRSYVSGWGFTFEHKDPATVLKELEVPIISGEQCEEELSEDDRKYLTDDKLCAGFLSSGVAVCKGDSGGGLVGKYENKYFVIGVVSLSPQSPSALGGCDSHQYSLYTKVSYYIENFIVDYEARFRPSLLKDDDIDKYPNDENFNQIPDVNIRGNCILPNYSRFAKWTNLYTSSLILPNMSVPNQVWIKLSCDKGYSINGRDIIKCERGTWNTEPGECLKRCSSLANTTATEISCTFRNNELKNCTYTLEGTIAKQKCAPFYESIDTSKNPFRVCREGSWDSTLIECVPNCGLLSQNEEIIETKTYPWEVDIYNSANKTLACTGTLISLDIVLTAAQCVTNSQGQLYPFNTLNLRIGKNSTDAQITFVKTIYLPTEWSGFDRFLYADLAIVITEKPFNLSKTVQTACVDWTSEYKEDTTTKSGFLMSNESKSLEVPLIPTMECWNSASDSFKPFFVSDKFCSGYLTQNKSACSGPPGSGFFTKYNGRYYITGILSVSPSTLNGSCNISNFTLFTTISTHLDFILDKEAESATMALEGVEHGRSGGSSVLNTDNPTSTRGSEGNRFLNPLPAIKPQREKSEPQSEPEIEAQNEEEENLLKKNSLNKVSDSLKKSPPPSEEARSGNIDSGDQPEENPRRLNAATVSQNPSSSTGGSKLPEENSQPPEDMKPSSSTSEDLKKLPPKNPLKPPLQKPSTGIFQTLPKTSSSTTDDLVELPSFRPKTPPPGSESIIPPPGQKTPPPGSSSMIPPPGQKTPSPKLPPIPPPRTSSLRSDTFNAIPPPPPRRSRPTDISAPPPPPPPSVSRGSSSNSRAPSVPHSVSRTRSRISSRRRH